MDVFKTISSATASRDLKKAVESRLILAEGKGNQMRYFIYRQLIHNEHKIKEIHEERNNPSISNYSTYYRDAIH